MAKPLVLIDDSCMEFRLISEAYVSIHHPLLLGLYATLYGWNERVPLKSVTLQLSEKPCNYRYHVQHRDGREWEQCIDITGDDPATDPAMTFSVKHYWRVSEIAEGREVQMALIQAVLTLQVTDAVVTFYE